MDILFVFKSENFLVPIGLCSISAVAKQAGWNSHLCEMNSMDLLETIEKIRPAVIAYSSSTGEAKHYLAANEAIKKRFPEIFTIMGGPHPTFFPEVLEKGSLDAICMGEGDEAFEELLSVIALKGDVNKIANIKTHKNGDTFRLRPLTKNLDSLPFPDFSLLYDNTGMGKYPLKSIMTSRGCPYECTYCFNTSWREMYKGLGPSVRRHSVDYVIRQIKLVQSRWPLSFVKFYDDIFTYRADDWLKEFCERYPKEIGLPFFILTRADLLTEDMVRILKSAGCHTISMSIEAGNPEVRKDLLKRDMTNEQIIHAHDLCTKYGIHTFTNCIIGLPGTSLKEDMESIDLCLRCKVTWGEFLIFHPFPATELGRRTVNMGYYEENYDKMHTSYQHSSPLNCFTAKEKKEQMNIAVLGAVVLVFPWLNWLFRKVLIKLPYNPVYPFVYYLTKMYILRTKIYVTKTTRWESIKIFARSLKQEWFRHMNKKG